VRQIRTLHSMRRGLETRFTARLVRHSQRKRGATDRPDLRSVAPVLDPTLWVAAGIPRGNRAGTLAESGIYSQQPRNIRRLQVYARKHVENTAAKGEMDGSRLLRE